MKVIGVGSAIRTEYVRHCMARYPTGTSFRYEYEYLYSGLCMVMFDHIACARYRSLWDALRMKARHGYRMCSMSIGIWYFIIERT